MELSRGRHLPPVGRAAVFGVHACLGRVLHRSRDPGLRDALAPYPPAWQTRALAVAIYVNFFAHHWLPDARWLLFAATVAVYGHCRVWFRLTRVHRMPLVLAAFLSSMFLWIAENVGTRTGTWLYAGQAEADPVSFAKIGSWYLLLYVSFVTVTIAAPHAVRGAAPGLSPDDRARPAPTEPRPRGSSART